MLCYRPTTASAGSPRLTTGSARLPYKPAVSCHTTEDCLDGSTYRLYELPFRINMPECTSAHFLALREARGFGSALRRPREDWHGACLESTASRPETCGFTRCDTARAMRYLRIRILGWTLRQASALVKYGRHIERRHAPKEAV